MAEDINENMAAMCVIPVSSVGILLLLFYRQDLWASFLTEYATVEDRLRRKVVELKQTEDEFKVWIESFWAFTIFLNF
jgi:hypothetical protein